MNSRQSRPPVLLLLHMRHDMNSSLGCDAVLFGLFEKQLKLLYPHAPEITYDLRDMYQWLDQLVGDPISAPEASQPCKPSSCCKEVLTAAAGILPLDIHDARLNL